MNHPKINTTGLEDILDPEFFELEARDRQGEHGPAFDTWGEESQHFDMKERIEDINASNRSAS